MVANVPLPWLGGEPSDGSANSPYSIVRTSVVRMVRLRRVRLPELGVSVDDVAHETLLSLASSRSPYVHGTAMPHPKYFEVTAFRFVVSLGRRRSYFVVNWSAPRAELDFQDADDAPARADLVEAGESKSTLSIVLARERDSQCEHWRSSLPPEQRMLLGYLEDELSITAIARLTHFSRSHVKRTREKLRQSATRNLRVGPFSRGSGHERLAPESLN
jgi:DNA-directed RNA polymerase specialized sigma24 family protein